MLNLQAQSFRSLLQLGPTSIIKAIQPDKLTNFFKKHIGAMQELAQSKSCSLTDRVNAVNFISAAKPHLTVLPRMRVLPLDQEIQWMFISEATQDELRVAHCDIISTLYESMSHLSATKNRLLLQSAIHFFCEHPAQLRKVTTEQLSKLVSCYIHQQNDIGNEGIKFCEEALLLAMHQGYTEIAERLIIEIPPPNRPWRNIYCRLIELLYEDNSAIRSSVVDLLNMNNIERDGNDEFFKPLLISNRNLFLTNAIVFFFNSPSRLSKITPTQFKKLIYCKLSMGRIDQWSITHFCNDAGMEHVIKLYKSATNLWELRSICFWAIANKNGWGLSGKDENYSVHMIDTDLELLEEPFFSRYQTIFGYYKTLLATSPTTGWEFSISRKNSDILLDNPGFIPNTELDFYHLLGLTASSGEEPMLDFLFTHFNAMLEIGPDLSNKAAKKNCKRLMHFFICRGEDIFPASSTAIERKCSALTMAMHEEHTGNEEIVNCLLAEAPLTQDQMRDVYCSLAELIHRSNAHKKKIYKRSNIEVAIEKHWFIQRAINFFLEDPTQLSKITAIQFKELMCSYCHGSKTDDVMTMMELCEKSRRENVQELYTFATQDGLRELSLICLCSIANKNGWKLWGRTWGVDYPFDNTPSVFSDNLSAYSSCYGLIIATTLDGWKLSIPYENLHKASLDNPKLHAKGRLGLYHILHIMPRSAEEKMFSFLLTHFDHDRIQIGPKGSPLFLAVKFLREARLRKLSEAPFSDPVKRLFALYVIKEVVREQKTVDTKVLEELSLFAKDVLSEAEVKEAMRAKLIDGDLGEIWNNAKTPRPEDRKRI